MLKLNENTNSYFSLLNICNIIWSRTSMRTEGSVLLSFRPRGRGGKSTTINHCCALARMQNTQYTLLHITAEFYSLPWWFFIFLDLTLFFHFYFNLFLFLFFLLHLASFSPLLWHFPTKIEIQCNTPRSFLLFAFYKDLSKNWIEVQVYLSSPTSKQKYEQGLRNNVAVSRALKALARWRRTVNI